ncbi:MAG: hypothetical protein U5J63_03195 [Fodinibius sp.]|nr:hypothetical protein [Fodinibius sp.]
MHETFCSSKPADDLAMDISDGQQPTLDPEKWTELMYKAIPELSRN